MLMHTRKGTTIVTQQEKVTNETRQQMNNLFQRLWSVRSFCCRESVFSYLRRAVFSLSQANAETILDFRKPEKNTSNTIITQAYQSRCSWRPSESLETFLNPLYNTHQARGNEEKRSIRNRISDDFDKRRISQPKTNKQTSHEQESPKGDF